MQDVMRIEDAVAHLDELLTDPIHDWGCEECKKEHIQLRDWLVELINRRANVHPVVHGQWIDKRGGAYGRMQSWCSACGKHSGIGGIETNRHKNFCPNCGAKMDGGANNDKR